MNQIDAAAACRTDAVKVSRTRSGLEFLEIGDIALGGGVYWWVFTGAFVVVDGASG